MYDGQLIFLCQGGRISKISIFHCCHSIELGTILCDGKSSKGFISTLSIKRKAGCHVEIDVQA